MHWHFAGVHQQAQASYDRLDSSRDSQSVASAEAVYPLSKMAKEASSIAHIDGMNQGGSYLPT